MKKKLYIASLVALVCGVAHAAEKGKHLFILSGQSNMYYLDENISFVPTVEAAFGKENVTVVKDSLGGQPIRRWYKQWKAVDGYDPEQTGYPLYSGGKVPGDLYDRLLAKVEEATREKEFSTVTFVWMQGERDAKESHGEVYAESLVGLFQQLSDDLGREDINVVVGRLSDYDMANEKYPHWTMVRDALVEVVEAHPRATWVNTDDLNDGINKAGRKVHNSLHYTVEGYRLFGERLAHEAIQLCEVVPTDGLVPPVLGTNSVSTVGKTNEFLKLEIGFEK
ncbi:hypothetical protein PDESU_02412 [Pontiella desulfatans]|uniref:Sialate O-acetylesterase domain-containing protein n=1 Tax=Pontiella desulfatans TaxID=2750659 RepID=A0A6C2U1U3_PONDE|nr:sialate O-acetylesterase [Pontiella desulfatans]VGO13855.1 hypothetical protein PDESU_02412 [Pontiella desulfatans]